MSRAGQQLVVWARIARHVVRLACGAFIYRRPAAGSAPRIAFQAYSTHLAQFFVPVARQLLETVSDLEIHFVILDHPHYTVKDSMQLRRWAADELGLPPERIHNHALSMWQPWNLLICADLFAAFPLRRTRTCFLAHGPGLTSRAITPRLGRKTVWDFDLVLASGPYDHQLLQANRVGAATEVVATGIPFLDDLLQSTGPRDAYLQTLGLDPGRPTVLFAPAWEPVAEQQDHGYNYVEGVINALCALEVNLVVKLHSCLFNRYMSHGPDWRSLLEDLCKDRDAVFDSNIDDRPALSAADVLVTDISSRALNFMTLEKPVVLFMPPAGGLLSQLDQQRLALIKGGSIVVRSLSKLGSSLESVLAGDWNRDAARAASMRAFSNAGTATDAVTEVILGELRRYPGGQASGKGSWRES